MFFDEDYKRAFDQMCSLHKYNQLPLHHYKEYMTKTMGFPPLDEEVDFFIRFSGKTTSDTMTWDEIKDTLHAIRDHLNETAKQSVKYDSFKQYYYDTYKHIRKGTEPNVVFKSPSTAGQNYGFYKFQIHDLNNIHYPKRKCEETKYAECLVMTKFLN